MPGKRKIEYRAISALKPHPNNVRTHPTKQIDLLVNSINIFGVTAPPLVDEHDIILAGTARFMALQKAGYKEVPVIVMRGLSEAKKRAYVLADNKIAALAGYDRPALADELNDLSALLVAEGLDLKLTGFEAAEIDVLMTDLVDQPDTSIEPTPDQEQHPVTRRGDLWVLGNKHRLLCEDARQVNYGTLMQGKQAGMLFSDVPYNLDVRKVVGRGRIKHPNFAMAAGELSSADYTSFLVKTLGPASANVADGALCFIFGDWRHQREILEVGV